MSNLSSPISPQPGSEHSVHNIMATIFSTLGETTAYTVLVLAFLAYVMALHAIRKSLRRKSANGAYRQLLSAAMTLLVLGPLWVGLRWAQEQIDERRQAVKQLPQLAEVAHKEELRHICQREEKLRVYRTIPPQSGIFVRVARPGSRMTWNGEDVWWQTCAAAQEPACADPPIVWAQSGRAVLAAVQKSARPALVEYAADSRPHMPAAWQQRYWDQTQAERLSLSLFGESGHYIERAATRSWWRQSGQQAMVAAWGAPLGENAPSAHTDDGAFMQPLPVSTLLADYRLSVADISTAADRRRALRRGRMLLEELHTGQTVAEYIGFDTLPLPDFGVYASWHCRNLDQTATIPVDATKAVFRYFFAHVLADKHE